VGGQRAVPGVAQCDRRRAAGGLELRARRRVVEGWARGSWRGALLWRAIGQRGSLLQRAAVGGLRAVLRRRPGVGEQVLSSSRRRSSLSLFSVGAPPCRSTAKFITVVPSSPNFPSS